MFPSLYRMWLYGFCKVMEINVVHIISLVFRLSRFFFFAVRFWIVIQKINIFYRWISQCFNFSFYFILGAAFTRTYQIYNSRYSRANKRGIQFLTSSISYVSIAIFFTNLWLDYENITPSWAYPQHILKS